MTPHETVLSQEVVLDLLTNVITEENIINPIYDISSGSAKGDGYTSNLTRVDIEGSNKVLHLIIKSAPKDEKLRETMVTRSFFTQEINFYKTIYPAFVQFQDEKRASDPFSAVAKCYGTRDAEMHELLIFENLKENGFRVFDKTKQMDEAHVQLVLKEYGKLHAVSFAMKDQEKGRFEDLTRDLGNPLSTTSFNPDFFDVFLEGCERLKTIFKDNQDPNIYGILCEFKDNVIPFFKTLDRYSGKFGVVTHGDCWCNNMMFKYQDENSAPTDLRLFDFQISTLTSPVLDLAYFFYVTASKEMLDNLDHYLRIYYDSLREHMLDMGSDVEKYLTFNDLKKEWKTYGKYGLIMALVVFRVMLRHEEETLDGVDAVNSGLSMTDTFMNESRNDGLINERYSKLVVHMYENNFL